MSEFAQRNVRTESSGSGPSTPRKGVEEATDDKTETRKDTRDTHSGDTELPRNENLRKDADEAYGDTEIPERKNDV
jgi:hypothetical protein